MSIDTTTNQRSAVVGRGKMVIRHDRCRTCGEDLFLLFGVANVVTKKVRYETGLGLKWLPLAKATQQPTENSMSIGAGIRDVNRPRQNIWGGQLLVLLNGDLSNKK